MKWPASVTLARHAESAYNELRLKKLENSLYRSFEAAYAKDYLSSETRRLALEIKKKYALSCSDFRR